MIAHASLQLEQYSEKKWIPIGRSTTLLVSLLKIAESLNGNWRITTRKGTSLVVHYFDFAGVKLDFTGDDLRCQEGKT